MSLKFAVIGYGNRGRSHREGFEELGAQAVAVADVRPPTIEDSERFGDRYYRNYRELLRAHDKLDFAVVASQEAQHVEQSLALLTRGVPVYLEKAPSNRWEDAVHLYREVQQEGHPLFIGYNLRRFPAAGAAAEVLRAGRIGRVQHVLGHVNTGNAWGSKVFYRMFYGDAEYSGDIVLAKLTHDTDWVQHALGTSAATCTASAGRTIWTRRPDAPVDERFLEGLDPEREYTSHDVATLTGRFENGTHFTFVFTTAGPMHERRYLFSGSLGQLEASLHNDRPDEPDAWVRVWRCGSPPEQIPLAEAHGSHGGADPVVRRDFLNWLASGATEPHEPMSILTGMILPTAGLEAARTGCMVDCTARLREAMKTA